MFGVPDSDLGALLIGIGAALLVFDAAFGGRGFIGMTWGGTLPQPSSRASAAAELVGSVLVALGSGILLFDARHLTALLAVGVVAVAAALVYLGMAVFLRAHLRLIAKDHTDQPERSLWWCLRHPLWRPPPPN